jgi:hypothetical protein
MKPILVGVATLVLSALGGCVVAPYAEPVVYSQPSHGHYHQHYRGARPHWRNRWRR